MRSLSSISPCSPVTGVTGLVPAGVLSPVAMPPGAHPVRLSREHRTNPTPSGERVWCPRTWWPWIGGPGAFATTKRNRKPTV